MDETQAQSFVREAARVVLRRTANPPEFAHWTHLVLAEGPAQLLVYLDSLVEKVRPDQIFTHWPNGHYYSPVVKPDSTVLEYWTKERELKPNQIQGIDLDLKKMIDIWITNADYLLANPFPDQPNGVTRYHMENGSFPGGDAVFIGAIMRVYRPKRIIEIGSGNSTACMLDWAERLHLDDLDITCIEPDPGRVKSVLRAGDRVSIIESLVQNVDLKVGECQGSCRS